MKIKEVIFVNEDGSYRIAAFETMSDYLKDKLTK